MIIQFTNEQGDQLAVFRNADRDEVMDYIDNSEDESLLMQVLDFEGVDPQYKWLYLMSVANGSSLKQRVQMLFYSSDYGENYTLTALAYVISKLGELEEIDLDDYSFEVGIGKTMSDAHKSLSESIIDEYHTLEDDLTEYFDYESHGADSKTWGIEYNGRYYALHDRNA